MCQKKWFTNLIKCNSWNLGNVVINHLKILSASCQYLHIFISKYPSSFLHFPAQIFGLSSKNGRQKNREKKHICLVIQAVTFLGWWFVTLLRGCKRDLQRSGMKRSRIESPGAYFCSTSFYFQSFGKNAFSFGGKICVDNKNSPCFFGGALLRVDKLCPTHVTISQPGS